MKSFVLDLKKTFEPCFRQKSKSEFKNEITIDCEKSGMGYASKFKKCVFCGNQFIIVTQKLKCMV